MALQRHQVRRLCGRSDVQLHVFILRCCHILYSVIPVRFLFFNTRRSGPRFDPTRRLVEQTIDTFCWEDIDTHLEDKWGYSKEINKVWGRGDDLFFLEEDKLFTVDMINSLVKCSKSGVCSQLTVYPRYDLKRRKWLAPFVCGVYKEYTNHLGYPDKRSLFEGEEWGEWMDLGLLKVTARAQAELPAPEIEWGSDHIRLGVSFRKAGTLIHAHRPIAQHLHPKISWNYNEDYSLPLNPGDDVLQQEIRSVMERYKPEL